MRTLFCARLGRCAAPVGLAFAAIVACSGNSLPDASDVADASIDAPAQPGLIARFNLMAGGAAPAPFEIPFPSDAYREENGTLIDTLDNFAAVRLRQNTDAIATGFAGLDGFGLNTGAMFLIDGMGTDAAGVRVAVDPASLPSTAAMSLTPDATAYIVDLDPSATAATARVPCVAGYHPVFRTITVQPERAILQPGRRYAVVITTGVRATVPPYTLLASPAFAAIRDNAPNARTGGIGMMYGAAVDRVAELSGAGFERTRIAALAVFTTQTTSRQLRRARDQIVANRVGPPPPLDTDPARAMPFSVVRFGATAHTGWTATLDQWLGTPLRTGGRDVPGFPSSSDPLTVGMAHDAIGVVFAATYNAPDYRNAEGEIRFMADGTPVVGNANQRIAVTIALPRGPVPPGGFPVVIYGHGLGGQRREMISVANELARAGFATAAIDWPTFGQRSVAPESRSLERGTYRGPDGFGDAPAYPTLDFFGNLTNLLAFRDNVRQGALDVAQLRRVLANPALDLTFVADEYGGSAPRIDGAHIGYLGNSLGGIMGTVIGGSNPDINPIVLNVPGGGILTVLAPQSPGQAGLLSTAANIIFGAPSEAPLDRFHPLSNLFQMIIDGGDAAAYAREITHPSSGRPHDVWMVGSLHDEVLANAATELLASIMELPQIRPVIATVPNLVPVDAPVMANLPMGATAGFLYSAPSTHGANLGYRYGEHRFAPPFPRSGPMRFPALTTPFRVRESIVAFQQNIGAFFASSLAGSARIVITGMEPIADSDDDGWTDDEERTGMTDPFNPTSHPAGTPPHMRSVGF